MAAARKLLVDLLMAGAAVSRRDMGGDDEPVVVLAIWLLSFLRLVTIETANALAGVLAHLVFMDDGILLARNVIRRICRWL